MRLPQGKNLFGNISSCIVPSVMSQYCNIACLAISILQYGLFGNITILQYFLFGNITMMPESGNMLPVLFVGCAESALQ